MKTKVKKIKKLIKELRSIKEDGVIGGPTNAVGTGAIAGAGVGPYGEPGVHPENQPGYKKRKKYFSNKNPKSPVMSGIYKRKQPKDF